MASPWFHRIKRASDCLTEALETLADWESGSGWELKLASNKAAWEDVWFLHVYEEPPPTIPLLVSEWAHHLRSALDNIVWSIHVTQGGSVSDDARRIAFPLVTDANRWDRRAKETLAWATPEQTRSVRAAQPFVDPGSPLPTLFRINNSDKHEMMHVGAFGDLDVQGRVPHIDPLLAASMT